MQKSSNENRTKTTVFGRNGPARKRRTLASKRRSKKVGCMFCRSFKSPRVFAKVKTGPVSHRASAMWLLKASGGGFDILLYAQGPTIVRLYRQRRACRRNRGRVAIPKDVWAPSSRPGEEGARLLSLHTRCHGDPYRHQRNRVIDRQFGQYDARGYDSRDFGGRVQIAGPIRRSPALFVKEFGS